MEKKKKVGQEVKRSLTVQEIQFMRENVMMYHSSNREPVEPAQRPRMRTFSVDGKSQIRHFNKTIEGFVNVWQNAREEKAKKLQENYSDVIKECNVLKDSIVKEKDNEKKKGLELDLSTTSRNLERNMNADFVKDKDLIAKFTITKNEFTITKKTDDFIKGILNTYQSCANDIIYDRICEEFELIKE